MDRSNLLLTVLSFGLVSVFYAAFALRLLQVDYFRVPREWSKLAILAAVVFSALWGCFGLVTLGTEHALPLALSSLSDQLRYAGWYAFLLLLLRSDSAQKVTQRH